MATPISKWWPIYTGIKAVIFFIIGGALIGTFETSIFCDDYGCYGEPGLWAGGVAMCVLGAATTIAWVVLLVLYLTRRRKSPQQLNPSNPTTIQPTPQPLVQELQTTTKETARFCGQCGSSVYTPFCSKCGANN
jgi:hypothetical protein